MPETTIELIIRARDEASRVVNQAIAQTRQAAQAGAQANQALEQSSRRLSQATEVTSRELRVAGTSARFAALSLANELSPALGTGVARLTSLASVAAFSGTALGALATIGIGGLVLALGSFIKAARDAADAQQELNRAVALGQVPKIQEQINSLKEREVKLVDALNTAQALGDERLVKDVRLELALIREQIELRERSIRQINLANIAGAVAVERGKEEEQQTKALASAAASWAQAQGDVLAQKRALRELEPMLLEELANTRALTEARRTLDEASARAQRERAASLENLERQAESIAEGQAEAVVAEIEKIQEPMRRLMTSLGNTMADTLFDALIGRSRTLEQALRSAFEHAARNVFRDTVVPLFGGKSSGFGLQDLLRL